MVRAACRLVWSDRPLCRFVKIFVNFVVKYKTTNFTRDTKIVTKIARSNVILFLFEDWQFDTASGCLSL